MQYAEKPSNVRVTGEASSLAVEWSHDVCRFLLKWLPGLELKALKSSQVSTEKNSAAKSFGMYTESNQIFQSNFWICFVQVRFKVLVPGQENM